VHLVGIIYQNIITMHGPMNIKFKINQYQLIKHHKIIRYFKRRLLFCPQVTFGLTLHTVCMYVACLPCQLLTSILITPCNKLLV
jgi:hypothetical protein